MKDLHARGLPDSGGGLADGEHGAQSAMSRLLGAAPWLMIGGLLYAGLFIKPEPVGGAVVPPSIERRDLLLGVTSLGGTQWLAGNFGKILKSEDGGGSWKVQSSGTGAHLQDIEAWDANRAVAVGNAATVLITADGGAIWKTVAVPHSDIGNKLMRVRVGTSPGEAWAVGEMGAILHTLDFGASWQVMRPSEDVIMSDIDVSNPASLWIVGEYGRLFHSTDHGFTWTAIKSASASSLTAIEFRNRTHGLAVGLDGAMLATRDGGGTWEMLNDKGGATRQHLFGVKWDEMRGEWLAVGAKGVWVSVRGDFGSITTGRLSSSDLSAHTKIALSGTRAAIIAGASPGLWDRKSWQSLIGK